MRLFALPCSTIPEVIAARHAGVRVLVLSLCTNIVVNDPYQSAERAVEREQQLVQPERDQPIAGASADGDSLVEKQQEVASHQEVLDVSARRANDMRALVEMIVDDEF